MEGTMIDDGRAYGVALALKHILGLLERSGVIEHRDLGGVLDDALAELKSLGEGVIAPEAGAAAAKTIGLLYLR
jgi:hypothetical protein